MRLRPDTAFLFDFDGTIVDSLPLHDRAFRTVIEDVRPDLLASFDYDAFKGMETAAVFHRLGFDGEDAARSAAAKRRAYGDLVTAGELRFMPDAEGCLSALAERGLALYVATSGSRQSVSAAMTALGIADLFAGSVTASDVARGKPAPDIFLKLLADFAIEPERAVVIEDAASGVLAARAAGLPVIGVYDPAVEGMADFYLPTLDGLPALIATVKDDRHDGCLRGGAGGRQGHAAGLRSPEDSGPGHRH